MNRTHSPSAYSPLGPPAAGGRVPRRLLAADWARLSEEAQDQALAIARHEGRRAARWYLAEPAGGGGTAARSGTGPRGAAGGDVGGLCSLRDCRWAQEHGNLDPLPDHIFYLYATQHTFPCEVDYLTFVVEPYCPERISWWWRIPRAHRLEDPRVCAFCDAYERERCRVLGLEEPPTSITDLKRYLREAKEQERESGRGWLARSVEFPPGEEEPEWSAERWEHQRCMLATDLAQMLLDAALCRAQVG